MYLPLPDNLKNQQKIIILLYTKPVNSQCNNKKVKFIFPKLDWKVITVARVHFVLLQTVDIQWIFQSRVATARKTPLMGLVVGLTYNKVVPYWEQPFQPFSLKDLKTWT